MDAFSPKARQTDSADLECQRSRGEKSVKAM